MKKSALLVILGIIVLIIFGVTFWFSINSSDGPTGDPTEEVGYVPQIINAKHQFEDGIHTVAGEVDVPTPCDLLETDSFVEVREPDVDKAVIQFSTLNTSETCAQVITQARFKEVFAAGENAEITAQWNGVPVKLNLIETRGESLEEFELFIKG